jgi:hypothetical protein
MNDETMAPRRPLVGGGTLVAVLLIAVLWQSNPDEDSFRQFLVRQGV